MKKYIFGLFLILLLIININVKAAEKTNVYFSVLWSDNANTSNQRPSSVTVDLMNGETVVDTMEVSASSEWKGTFSNVDKYDSNNSRISYKVREHDINDYNISIYQGETIDGYTYPNNISDVEINTGTNTSPIIDVPGTNGWKIQKGLQHDLIPGTHVIFNPEQFSLTNATLKEYDADGNEVTRSSEKKFRTSDSCQVEGARYHCVLLIDDRNIPLNTLIEVDHYITLTFHDAATVIEGPDAGTTHDVILTAKNIKTYKVYEKGLKIFQDGPFIGPSNVYYNTGASSIDVNIKVDGVTTGSVLMSFYDIDITENLGGDEYPWVESIILLNGFEKTVYTTTLDGELSTIYTKFEETDEGYFRAYAENEHDDANKTMRSGFVAMANLSEEGIDIRWQGSTCSTKLFGDVSSFKLKTTINGISTDNPSGTISELSDWKSRNYGEAKVVTVTPSNGYHIKNLTIDSNVVDTTNFDANGYMELTTGYTLNGNTGTEVIKLYQRESGKIDIYLPAQYFSNGQDTIPERVDHWIDVSFEDNNSDSFNIVNKLITPGTCPTPSDNPNTLFEGIGHYAFATAGSNNAKRPSSHTEHDWETIISYPDNIQPQSVANQYPIRYNWNTVKNKIAQKEGITSYTNMSGSYLDVDGDTEKAMFSYWMYLNPNVSTNRILIIAPDGEFTVEKIATTSSSSVTRVNKTLDITDFVSTHGKGWYFVSFLDAYLMPQNSWSITAVYENENLDLSYLKLINVMRVIGNGTDLTLLFDSEYELKGEFQLLTITTGAGISGWAYPGQTEDEAWAILEDNTKYRLYDRGDGHFTGRTTTEFFNDIFSTIRSHNIQGGELDIFDETLDISYFGGKEPIGYYFKKTGENGENIAFVGLRKTIEIPKTSIVTDIEDQTLFGPGDDVNVTTTILNEENDNNICEPIYNNIITSKVDSKLTNIRNIVVTYDGNNYIGVYNATNGYIEVEEIAEIDCHKPVVLTYTGTIKDNIQSTNNKYRIEAESFLKYAIVQCDPFKQIISDDDFIESPIPAKVIAHHYIEGTETKVHDDVIQDKYMGDPYTTTYVASSSLYQEYANRYAFNGKTAGDSTAGTITKTPIEVIYYYEPITKPIEGTKTWIDGGREHNNASDLTIILYRNGEALDLVPTWDGNKFTFNDINIYDDSHNEYTYTIDEVINSNVPDHEKYIKTINGFDITNKLIDGEFVITGTKTWIDDGRSHNNPVEIKLTLYRESKNVEKEVVTATIIWSGNTYIYEGLDKYDSYGYPYTYSVVEEPIEGYDTYYDGLNITNVSQQLAKVIVVKEWDDDEYFDQNGNPINGYKREEVVIKLYANGKQIDDCIATEENNWTCTFDNLRAYDKNGKINYTATEETLEGFALESINRVEEINEDGTITYKITITNKPVDKEDDVEPIILKILKVSKEDGKPLSEAIFKVEKDGVVKEYTTDSNGYIEIEFMEEGVYTLTEIKAPQGYILDETKYTIKVKKELVKVDLSGDGTKWEWKYKLVFDEETIKLLENNILKITNEKEIIPVPPTGDKVYLYIIALIVSMINISLLPFVKKSLENEG